MKDKHGRTRFKERPIVPRDPRFDAALRDSGVTPLGVELAALVWFAAPHLFAVAARTGMEPTEVPSFVALLLRSFASDLLRAEERDRAERAPRRKGKR